ncbi:alcohol dehydrogenase catalytic domain-containing protein [Frankia sp. AgB1.9]|uniref:alcohol dehydrogenase catalytic domain-containing protein n=1 Tax=unclassified Frankia TaxID=2632575 RepID=UPI00193388E7|nr:MULTISPECIES: alcohol dehydrogenase catalytic domain-containing protein [unclassified Frankia]MBL7492936.1 alcohol dehydrogenase catalytic domain-containing protein [Frankia sp. AgW1.1]MBL7550536.1 alcohol dehydrogenase catalytic domain-containing protein [Frankia sp. AgB1.9]MBL7624948.1 alcohol dehydrogenase catalytic domain-containing protein [Frankia sp. AgB1.8]
MSRAVVLTGFGPPDVLELREVEVGPPGTGQIRVAVTFAGVGPTDLAIRAGQVKAFPAGPGTSLGFEAAGVVDAVGSEVHDVAPGQEVAVFLPRLGGYAEHVLAEHWVPKPASVSWEDAAALPASGEAAARTLAELDLREAETLLLLGGLGSVGTIATQLAVGRGARVISGVRAVDFAAAEKLGAVPVAYGPDLLNQVRAKAGRVDAVLDAAGKGGLEAAIELAGGPERVITLADHRAAQLGVRFSGPDPRRIPAALAEAMAALTAGGLTLRPRITVPLAQAADVHAQLEDGRVRAKVLLAT